MNTDKKPFQLSWIFLDILKAALIGIIFGAAAALIFFLIGFAAGGFSALSGLETAKNILLLLGALGLFVLAGMLLIKGKKPEKFSKENGWADHFKIIGMKSVIGAICIAVLAEASAIDSVMIWLKK